MEKKNNHATLCFDAKSVNEGFARMAVMAFMTDMNPTIEQLEDVKTAVSEAVTNAIIHGYQKGQRTEEGEVEMILDRDGPKLVVQIIDKGVGIENIEEALQPFFTTKPELERSGMGFAFMDAFMDELLVYSNPGMGTRVVMTKYIERTNEQ
jgi:stage II sporulation protein AB (anti-sigma F factor)